MRNDDSHIPDLDLVMHLDGELSLGRDAEVLAHLEGCELCRDRIDSIAGTLEDFSAVHRESLDLEIPPAGMARARLVSRLEEASWRRVPGSPMGWFAALAACAFALVLVMGPTFYATVKAEGPRPQARLTPGETRPVELREVCASPRAEVVSRDIPEKTRREVFAAYGIRPRDGAFEVDYLVTPDLGGVPSLRNLWPEPYSARWNARVKDALEQRLHQLVCEGQVDLGTAQREMATDWIGAYKKYFHTNRPIGEQ
jgi:hypothetical protein